MNLRIETGWFYADDLNPRQGTEPGKVRPGLVVQSDLLNEVGHASTVVAGSCDHLNARRGHRGGWTVSPRDTLV